MEREEEISEEQRKRADANRAAALAKRKAALSSTERATHLTNNPWSLFKCRKLSPKAIAIPKQPIAADSIKTSLNPEKFRARFEICSPDSFSITPVHVEGFVFPGEDVCFQTLSDRLSSVLSRYTQNIGGGQSFAYRLYDYHLVLKSLKNCKDIECEEIPWGTLNVVEKLSHSFIAGRWIPCRPEHLPEEKVDELIDELPKSLLNALLPFQLDGVRFGLRRGGRCLIADEMGLGKTLQAIAIAGCFMKEGSILIICPAILRHTWAEELERWFPCCLPSDVHLVFGHQDNPARLPKLPKIVVISYTMLRRLRSSMLEQKWATLIVDESHHLHCNKKAVEKDEAFCMIVVCLLILLLKAVLDMATKVKHLILLSGTPSLSRKYLSQVCLERPNMSLQKLIALSNLPKVVKEDFIRYCLASYEDLMDFSKGIRLEELNVLLKQSVMIRRLKENVLLELPPKRRQIIKLVLRKSDINSAMVTLGIESGDASADTNAENAPCHVSDKDEDIDMNKKLSHKLSALGLAKLAGFLEWLSIHPIMVEADGNGTSEESSSSHKMIVFAYHHKVLDGVQAFLCEKGTHFVRIDCTVTGNDRQSAIQSFQLSKKVKIALIGIRAGSSGLNLTSADNVVFLELPTTPGDIQQAEDRAHRHGQTRPVNIYIFCAKDTSDELQWQQLNKSLLSVSCTVNGKHDAIQEIEVERVSDFENTTDTSGKGDQPIRFQNSCLNLESHSQLPVASCDTNTNVLDASDEKHESGIMLNEDKCVSEGELEVKSSMQSAHLRFEISQHTGRIHLYSCIPGTNSRPTPLFKNFRQEEIECHSVAEINEKSGDKSPEDISLYIGALMDFIKEWKELRPIEKKKLMNKPLQLPLSYELCYLNESLTHDIEGLLRGGSKRRKTPMSEISCPLPSNASWRKVSLNSDHGQKEKLYTQGWTDVNEPLCKLCQTPCRGINATVPQYFEDLFCNLQCFEEYRSRTSNRFLRQELFKIENGICTNCKVNCHQLVKNLKTLPIEKREAYIQKEALKISKRHKLVDKLVNDPTEGNAWHADHIIPVYKGGGECKLENLRTLCVACHADVTTAQCSERRITRNKAKKQLKEAMQDLINADKSTKNDNVLQGCDSEYKSKEMDDDLFIEIPGSAYSTTSDNKTDKLNQE
ncbi:SNF2 and helicase domain-containing protein [Striga asiatica]|uniref:SNF2 and helicase domain-containing protein n=1 Tax=Striga asiatica TaxID=4170 RepID=A0A5A7R6B5_STRAF|nr:SNF2 and helicase domain-containing protein [Striga asiatica]